MKVCRFPTHLPMSTANLKGTLKKNLVRSFLIKQLVINMHRSVMLPILSTSALGTEWEENIKPVLMSLETSSWLGKYWGLLGDVVPRGLVSIMSKATKTWRYLYQKIVLPGGSTGGWATRLAKDRALQTLQSPGDAPAHPAAKLRLFLCHRPTSLPATITISQASRPQPGHPVSVLCHQLDFYLFLCTNA